MMGWFGVMLLLAVEFNKNCAWPIGDQITKDLSDHPTSEWLNGFESMSPSPTSSSTHFGSSSQDRWSLFPTNIAHNVPNMAVHPTQQGSSEAWLQDRTVTAPYTPVAHTLDVYLLDHHLNVLGTSDASPAPMSRYDSFNSDWIDELVSPQFAGNHPEIGHIIEPAEVRNIGQWQPQPLSAHLGPTSPADQTERPIHESVAVALENTQDTIRTRATLDFSNPTTPGNSPSLPANLLGQHESSDDFEISNTPLFPMTCAGPFDLDWIHELDSPKFTGSHPEISYTPEPAEVRNIAQWQPQPLSAHPGPSNPERPMQELVAVTLESTPDTIRAPVTSDLYDLSTPGYFPSLAGNLLGQHESSDDFGIPDIPLLSTSSAASSDLDWIHELEFPKFTGNDPEISYIPEPSEVRNIAQWHPQPPPAHPGPTNPEVQTSERPMHELAAVPLESTQDTIRTPVTSDLYDLSTPGYLPSIPGNLQGQHQSRGYNDRKRLRVGYLEPSISRTQKMKKYWQEKDEINGSKNPAEDQGHSVKQLDQSNKRKFHELEQEERSSHFSIELWISSKNRVLKHMEDTIKMSKENLEVYAHELRCIQRSHPIELLPDQNFRASGLLRHLLNANLATDNSFNKVKGDLKENIKSYQPYFSYPSPGEVLKQQNWSPIAKSNPSGLYKKIFTSLSHFVGRNHMISAELNLGDTALNLGETLKKLETDWLSKILESYSRINKYPGNSLFSHYECITVSTTTVLYHIGLLYRLIIPLNEEMKGEKDRSILQALNDLDELWKNFPYNDERTINLPHLNVFWEENLVDQIKEARIASGGIPPHGKVSRILLHQWLSRKSPYVFKCLTEPRKPAFSLSFYQILKDCAFLDYFSMKKERLPQLTTKQT